MFEELKQFQKERLQKMSSMAKEAEHLIKNMIKDFFQAHPKVARLRWTQYTPYFKDGDPCIFGIGELEFKYSEQDEEWLLEYSNETSKALAEDLKQFENLLNGLKDLLEKIFGDHVQVVCDRNQIQIETYTEHG